MGLMQDMLPAVEQELREATRRGAGRLGAGLDEMVAYHMGWIGGDAGGKRIRPLLVLMSCGGVCGDWARALPVAASVEFIHNFSLVHDDIQDQSPTRRGRETLWKRWGAAQAINAGDALFALATLATLESDCPALPAAAGGAALKALARACIELTRGQYLDLKAESAAQASLEFYWEMIRAKTGALVGAACAAGGLAGDAPVDQVASLEDFGLHLGLAFQIRDDVLGLWGDPSLTGKSTISDLESRKKSLPILFGLERCDEFRALLAGPFEPLKAPAMLRALESCGAREFAQAEGARMTGKAAAALERAHLLPEYDAALHELTASLLTRVK